MNLFRNIDRDKISFDFLVYGKGFFDDEIKKLGGKIFYMDYLTEVGEHRYKKDLFEFFRNHREYNIIHSHIDQVSGLILEVARKAGVKNRISHSHSTKNNNSLIGKIYKRYLQGKINKNATVFLACGKEAAKWLYKRQWKKAIIINNGIDIEKYKYSEIKRKKIREDLNISEEMLVIGHVGRFAKVKNHQFLVKIFNEFQKINKKSILVLVGYGPEIKRIENLVKKYSLEKKVLFLGLRQDVDEIYSAMDCVIFPSLYEGLSIALIEAQISGLKIFASDTIDKETDISGNIKWLSLKDSEIKWCKEIQNTNIERNLCKIEFENYDIKEIAKKVENIYLNLGE